MSDALVMEGLETSPSFVFVGHGYVRSADSERHSEHCTRYHSYQISGNHNLPDRIAFACEDSTALGTEKHSLPVEKSLVQQLGDLGEQPRLIRDFRRPSERESSD